MADINSIPTSSTPSSAPSSSSNVIDIATNKLGQRIGQTTEGVESVSTSATGTASSSAQSQNTTTAAASKRSTVIPESEEELRDAIEKHLESQIIEVKTEINTIKKQGGRGMAYHITVKVTELRQLQIAIKSLYEMAKVKLLEFYKAVFKVS